MEPRMIELRKSHRLEIEVLEERIAPSNGIFPPGQLPSGNPAQAPGQSNPNTVPATTPSVEGGFSFIFGVFSVDPAGAAVGHSLIHLFPETGVAGLKTAEAESGIVSWTPTVSG